MLKRNTDHKVQYGFPPPENPDALTVRDMLTARNLYGAALANMPNVIGTAIGLYRFRYPSPSREKGGDQVEFRPRDEKQEPRTLFNSRVTKGSKPAILVFVRNWYDHLPEDPRDVVPQLIYLRDGRVVPTCVIKLDLDPNVDFTASDPSSISFPENLIGGGCGVYTRVQGEEHVGTVACLATDGERLYGLAARHVVGPAGQPIYTRIRGAETRIGVSDRVQMKKKPFCEIYPEYCGKDEFATLDAGLIRLDETDWWTSQVLHIGELGDLADLHCANITLGMIGTPVRACGAVSGDRMKGEITALFPRYRGVGGVDYLADILVGPRPDHIDSFRVHGGDSGALLVLDTPTPKRTGESKRATPVAITWGSVDLVGGGTSRHLVLATFVSTICKALGVELVTRQNIGYRPIWGAQNHERIATIVVELFDGLDGKLREFLLGSGDKQEERAKALQQLAVLPDKWRGKRNWDVEGPNHYADIDKVVAGKRLADIPLAPEKWKEFYDAWEHEAGDTIRYGALPFRIGQVFDCLVDYLRKPNYKWAYAAAGALIHYIADACNPAHVTVWTRGAPDWKSSQHDRFHGIWDNEAQIDGSQVKKVFDSKKVLQSITDGQTASERALTLMKQTLTTVDVGKLVVSDNPPASYRNCRELIASPDGRKKIAGLVAHACELLFSLWSGAWREGDGDHLNSSKIAGLEAGKLYDEVLGEPEFLPSISL